jgi:hypothetical protein
MALNGGPPAPASHAYVEVSVRLFGHTHGYWSSDGMGIRFFVTVQILGLAHDDLCLPFFQKALWICGRRWISFSLRHLLTTVTFYMLDAMYVCIDSNIVLRLERRNISGRLIITEKSQPFSSADRISTIFHHQLPKPVFALNSNQYILRSTNPSAS